jgi:hypothetical protein
VQQAKRLPGALVDRHGSLKVVIFQSGKADPDMADHATFTGLV